MRNVHNIALEMLQRFSSLSIEYLLYDIFGDAAKVSSLSFIIFYMIYLIYLLYDMFD